MKKLLTVALLLVVVLGLSACGDKPTAKNRLEAIKERGYIQVVSEPYFVPFEFIDSTKTGDDKYVGVDVEIAKVIAEKLGVELRFIPLEFSAVLAGVTEGKYDVALSALAHTPVREEALNLSEGYYYGSINEYGMLIRAKDKDRFNSLESLSDAVVVAQSGSLQEGYVNGQIPKYKEFKRVSATTDGMLMIAEGKADACAVSVANANLYIQANPDADLMIMEGFTFTIDPKTQGTRAAMPKGEDELTEFVNGVLKELLESGQIEKWYTEYTQYAVSLGVK